MSVSLGRSSASAYSLVLLGRHELGVLAGRQTTPTIRTNLATNKLYLHVSVCVHIPVYVCICVTSLMSVCVCVAVSLWLTPALSVVCIVKI